MAVVFFYAFSFSFADDSSSFAPPVSSDTSSFPPAVDSSSENWDEESDPVVVADEDLANLCAYNKAQNKGGKYKTVLPEGESPFVFYDADPSLADPVVLISAPHAHRTFRYDEKDNTHASESRLGAIIQLVSELTGVPAIRKQWKSDDPNYYDNVPSETLTPGFTPGDELLYLAKIREYVAAHPSIKVVLDLHGSSKIGGDPENWAVDVGTGSSRSFQGAEGKGPQAQQIVEDSFANNGLHASDNRVYRGCCGQLTVTKFAAEELHLDALQFEIAKKYRSCNLSQREDLGLVVQSIVDTIDGLNNLYGSSTRRFDELIAPLPTEA